MLGVGHGLKAGKEKQVKKLLGGKFRELSHKVKRWTDEGVDSWKYGQSVVIHQDSLPFW